jgi:hypothetical protein
MTKLQGIGTLEIIEGTGHPSTQRRVSADSALLINYKSRPENYAKSLNKTVELIYNTVHTDY